MDISDDIKRLEKRVRALLPQQSDSQIRVEVIQDEAYFFISFDILQTQGEGITASIMEKLSRLFKKAQKKIGIPIHFLITKEDIFSLEMEIQDNINVIVQKQVANVWLSFASNNVADIFIVPKNDEILFSHTDLETIQMSITEKLKSRNLRFGSIQVKNLEKIEATLPIILRILRIKQPIDLKGLHSELQLRGFQVPQENWLKNQLDKLRRYNFLVFDKNTKLYLLTLQGIKVLSNQRGKRSDDVIHALEISRRRW